MKGSSKEDLQTRKKISIPIQKNKTSEKPPADNTPRITIWIHGTKSMSFISDFIHAVPYAGLKHVNNISSLYRIKSVIQALAKSDPQQFPLEHFYAYGWSGKLCFKKRKLEALKLYTEITHLISDYQQKYGSIPHITIVTHSHGGNVALNLALVPHKDPSLKLDLILLACPVQHETKNLIRDTLFNKIYSLYSPKDLMQIIDPQGLYVTQTNKKLHFELSERIFPTHESLRQARLEFNSKGLGHIGFILEKTIKALPAIISAIEIWEQEEPSKPDIERVLDVTLQDKWSYSLLLRTILKINN